jgi:sec-independent protein translocase protein TatA
MLIIGGIFILFFGSTKLPGLARSIGKSANEFKKGIRDDSALNNEDDSDDSDGEDSDGDGASDNDGDSDGDE